MEFDFCFAIENSRSFKTFVCSTNSSSHCLSRYAEHIRLTAFCWRCDEVEMRGTCLEAPKIDADKSCNQLLKIVLRYRKHLHEKSFGGIFRHSKEWKSCTMDIVWKKCTKYPFDSRAHLKTVRGLWFPASDRLEIWLILSRTIRSTRTIKRVNHGLTQPAYVPPLIVLTSTLSRSFRRKGQDKVPKTIVWG